MAGDVPIGHWRAVCRQPENRLKGNMTIKAAVVAEDELVEINVDVLAAKAVIGPEAPALQEGEHPMNPLEGNVGRHITDDAGIVPIVGDTRIGGMPSVTSVAPGAMLALMKAWMWVAWLLGIAASRMRPERVLRYLCPRALGLCAFPVVRSRHR